MWSFIIIFASLIYCLPGHVQDYTRNVYITKR